MRVEDGTVQEERYLDTCRAVRTAAVVADLRYCNTPLQES